MNRNADIAAIPFRLNGQPVETFPAPGERLSETLREALGARDVKIGCNAGDCGACTVLLDGAPVCACLTPTHQASGKTVETLQGLFSDDPVTQALAERFMDHGAAQCGICTPGMLVAATALLRDVSAPSVHEVETALGGVLCRCTGYRKIIDAVRAVPPMAEADGGIGTAIRRLDGVDKVTGREAFGDDVAAAGMLEVLVIRSPHPRAEFAFGDLAAFTATHALAAVLTAEDVPGVNRFGVLPGFEDQPVFAEGLTRFRGEAVAAIVGYPDTLAALSPEDFPITWTPLPDVADPGSAEGPDAPTLHDGHPDNILCRGYVATGDAAAALARADVTVEGRFRTGFVEHGYIEPEAGMAALVDGRLEVTACTQAAYMDQAALAVILGMELSEIRVIPTGVGGGFGSKLDLSVQPFLALAALRTGQPVRLCYTRRDTMQASTKRHPADIHLRIGATADGRLCGVDFDGTFDTGAYASWGPTVANRVPVHASGPYTVRDYRAQSKGVYTNNPPAGAFRGFGVPQSAIAQESLFDELALRLDIDPLEFRITNALENGVPTVCGQVFQQGVGIRACLAALRPAWAEARAEVAVFNAANTVLKRGVGVASGWYGCGNTSLPNPSTIKAGIRADGQVVLHQGAIDIGQGSNTVVTQIFAEVLGVPVAAISLIGGDTDRTPDAGKTSASRQTFVSGNAARLAGLALRANVLERLNVASDAALSFGDGVVTAQDAASTQQLDLSTLERNAEGYVLTATETYDPPIKPLDENGQGHPYAQFGYAAHLVVVEVDTALGTVKAQNFVAAHDVGKAINPMLVEGQVHGGIAQGLGMALMEEYVQGRTENLHDYLIPTFGDIPPIETIIIEEPDAHGPFGAKGLGEHVLIPTAPAILNAIAHATGARLRQVPATPSRVLDAIKGVS